MIKLNLKQLAEEFLDNYPVHIGEYDTEDLDSFLEDKTLDYLEDNQIIPEMERNTISIDIQPFIKLEIYNRVKDFDSEERETLKNEIKEYEVKNEIAD